MKSLAALPLAAPSLAALLALATAPSAQAFGVWPSGMFADREVTQSYGPVDYVPHDRCHGRTSGTAHHACGTATGGPSGGLF